MHVAPERIVGQNFCEQSLEHCPPHGGGTDHTLLQNHPPPLRVPQMDLRATGTAPQEFDIHFVPQRLLNTLVCHGGGEVGKPLSKPKIPLSCLICTAHR